MTSPFDPPVGPYGHEAPQWPTAPGPYPVAGVPYWGPQATWAPVDPTDCVGPRVAANVIDTVILIIPQIALMVGLLWGPLTEFFQQASRRPARGASPPMLGANFWVLYFAAIGLTWLVQFTYYFISERVWQGSPGKLMLGLRVVRANGYAPISWGQSAGRNALRVLFDASWIALILVLVTKGHRRVGDMAAHTLVIRKEWVGRFAEIWPPSGFPPWEPSASGPAQMVVPPQPGFS